MSAQAAKLFLALGLTSAAREAAEGACAPGSLIEKESAGDMSSAAREAAVKSNLAALGKRGAEAASHFDRWRESRGAERWLRARDGNIVRRSATGADWTSWEPLGDQRAMAVRFCAQHGSKLGLEPIVVEGACPPWFLMEVCRATPKRADGFWPRITIVQEDPFEFLDGLAHEPLEDVLSQERIEVIVGPGAAERLRSRLEYGWVYQVAGPVIPVLATRARTNPPVQEVVSRAVIAQRDLESAARARMVRLYAGRDAAWWRTRYRESLSGVGRPLRVLVPTCRYSTFIQHSSAGLVDAMQRQGHEAQILIEPDDCTRLTPAAYVERLASFEPDLIVLINYARSNLRGAIPANVPFVCWIQDAMPHLFDEGVGRAQGIFDYLAGHLHGELFTRFGYPALRLAPSAVVADDARFHAGPVDSSLIQEHECEIALASHHSETPEAMHERLMRESSGERLLQTVCRRLSPRIREAVGFGVDRSILATISRAVTEEVERVYGGKADARVESIVRRVYAVPLADRLIRHQALHWAADLSEAHGWRLRVYGRGWDKHPRFGRFARGELAHGEALRAAYRAAKAHLHASVNTLMHQRVMECALSGGLPVCRMHGDALASVRAWAQHAAMSRGAVKDRGDGRLRIDLAACPEAREAASILERVGDSSTEFLAIPKARAEALRVEAPMKDLAHHAAWLLGDLSMMTFSSRASLETVLGRAIEDSSWRAQTSADVAERVRGEMSMSAFARRLIGCVVEGLEEASAAAA